jgi:hypothetical protein
MKGNEEQLVLLILEDISEFTKLREIVPICMHCKKMRDDQNYWQNVEKYLMDFAGIDLSHGICPDCMKVHYPDAARKFFEKDT